MKRTLTILFLIVRKGKAGLNDRKPLSFGILLPQTENVADDDIGFDR